MAISSYSGANISSTTGTFAGWLAQHNEMVFDLSTVVVSVANATVANGTNGTRTSGNGDIDGFWSANVVIAKDSLRGGRNDEFGNSDVLTITSNTVIGNSTVSDTLTVYGDSEFQSNITLGSNSSDVVEIKASVNTGIIPDADDTRNLGSALSRWSTIYVDTVIANSSFTLESDDPNITITSSNTGASAAPAINLVRNSASPANNDILASLSFKGENDASESVTYALLRGLIENETDGAEDGSFEIRPIISGSSRILATFNNNGSGEVLLNFANSSSSTARLNTKEYGVLISGEMESDSIDVNGVADISGILSLHANLSLDDANRILLGTSDDFEIYHDGTHSYIDSTGTGDLYIRTDSSSSPIYIGHTSGNTYATFDDAEVILYANNAAALRSNTSGTFIAGELEATTLDINGAGDIQGALNLQSTLVVAGDTSLNSTTDSSSISSGALTVAGGLGITKKLFVGANADFADDLIVQGDFTVQGNFTASGDISLSISNSAMVDASVSNTLIVTGNTDLGNATTDSLTVIAKIDSGLIPYLDDTYTLGNSTFSWTSAHIETINSTDLILSNDLTVNGNTVIGSNTSDVVTLNARVSTDILPSANNSKDLGSSTLRWQDLYANSANFTTLSVPTISGVGSITSTNSTISGFLDVTGNTDLGSSITDSITFIGRVDSDIIPISDNLYDLGSSSKKFSEIHAEILNVSTNIDVPLVNVENQGDVRFFESSGSGSNYAAIQAPASLGANYTLTLPSALGSAGQFLSTNTTGGTSWSTAITQLTVDGNSGSENFDEDVNLYINGGTGVTTAITSNSTHAIASISIGQSIASGDSPTFAGLSLTGDFNSTANINLNDSDYLRLGTGNDFDLTHNGTISILRSSSNVEFRSPQLTFTNYAGDETLATFVDDGAVTLYYDNSIKFITTSSGVDITGLISTDTLNVSGDATFEDGLIISNTSPVVSLRDDGASSNTTVLGQISFEQSDGTQIGYLGYSSTSNEKLIISSKTTAGEVVVQSGAATDRWIFNSSGHMVPASNITYNVGNTTNWISTIYGSTFTGTANVASNIPVTDTSDTTSFVSLFENATGNQSPKTNAGITFNAGTETLNVSNMNISTDLTIGGDLRLSGADPVFTLTNTANSGSAELDLRHFPGLPADNDVVSSIRFIGYNDAVSPQTIRYGRVTSISEDVTDGNESGSILFDTISSGSVKNFLGMNINNDLKVSLYYDNSIVFTTESGGVEVDGLMTSTTANIAGNTAIGGNLTVTGLANFASNVSILDDDIFKIGTSSDLSLYHNGSHSYIDNSGTGDLYIRSTVAGKSVFVQHLDDDGSTTRNTLSSNVNNTKISTSNNTTTNDIAEFDHEDGVNLRANTNISGTLDFSAFGDQSLSANGYAVIGPLVMQWGVQDISGSNSTVTYPIAFGEVFSVQCTSYHSAAGFNGISVENDTDTLTQFTAFHDGALDKFRWLAIGSSA